MCIMKVVGKIVVCHLISFQQVAAAEAKTKVAEDAKAEADLKVHQLERV